MNALQALRIYGPCLVEDVARHTGVMWVAAADDLANLHHYGLAEINRRGLWDLTTQGVLEFEAACERAKKQRERDATCEGVRP